MTTVRIALWVLLLTFATTAGVQAQSESNWPQWRGPTRDGLAPAAPVWPDSLSGLSPSWQVEMGPGYSGPIVHGDRVFSAETEKEEREIVRALDRKTGRELWRASWPGAMNVPFFARSNGDWIRSTPACDGESLYVAGIRDVLVCLNASTGEQRWRVDFSEKMSVPLPAFGFVCSPLVIGDAVYVQAGGGFAKIDKKTGDILWHVLSDGGAINSAFSSPIEATIGGVRQILVQMREELAGVDPETGIVLWRQTVPAYRGMNILTPTVHGDGILTSTHKNKTFFYRIASQGGSLSAEQAWTLPGQGYMSSPVLVDGHAYLHLGNGRLSCIDLAEGKETWRSKSFGSYWSLIAQGRKILALDEEGELLLVEADPKEFRLLDRKKISKEETWGHVAVAGGQVFVRELNALSAFDWK